MAAKKQFPLRLDPLLYERLARWAADEFRSVNAHIELLLRSMVKRAERSGDSGDPSAALVSAGQWALQPARPVKEKKAFPLRIDAPLYEAVAAWAEREHRSVNAQIELMLVAAVVEAGRMAGEKR